MELIAPGLLVLLLIFCIWWFGFRNRKIISGDFPEEWQKVLNVKVAFYRDLSDDEKRRFENEIQLFLDSVTITGIKTEINDTDRLLVASSAVIPLFGFPGLRYRNINEVLLYENAFNNDHQTSGKERDILGKVGSGNMNRLMILSLPALRAGFENEHSKTNVGIHEFVHLIDMADGATDGIPESLMNKQYVLPWLKQMHQEIRQIKKNKSDINPYGSTNEVEFLSVVSEYFFNQPDKFQDKHPELYELMTHIFKQHP